MKSADRIEESGAVGIGLKIGDKAPQLTWTNGDGGSESLAHFLGNPLILAFLSDEWDPGQSHQLEIFNKALEGLPENVRLTSISSATEGIVGESDGTKFTVPILQNLSPRSELAREFGVFGQQAVFVLDGDGVIRYRSSEPWGGFPSAAEIENVIRSIPRVNLSRRQFVSTAVATLAAIMLLPRLSSAESLEQRRTESPKEGSAGTYTLHVNGHAHKIPADPRITVLDALRERIGLTGTKKGCDHGQCGACTIHMNGRRVNSCLVLAAQAEGAQLTTIEGLAHGDQLHPVQQAFIEHDGFQCGYCTPGQIMSAVACIKEGHTRSKEEIREWMSGNICRCGAYQGILEAIEEAKSKAGAL